MNKYTLMDSLKLHEGIRRLPYVDSEGFDTIGVGHKLDSIPLSDKAIDVILQDDIEHTVTQLHALIPYWHEGLSHERQNVIVEMAFQMGATGVKNFKKMWQAIKAENWEEAAIQMLDSKWAKQTPKRAETLSERMRNDVS